VRVVQIVPNLPPPFEGVGTYAEALAQALAKRFGIETRFVVGDPAWSGGANGANGAQPVQGRTATDLLAALAGPADAVLLHYANYGYQRRGCPVWLARAMQRWRGQRAGRRLVTVFHEVYATGPPWRSSFWTFPLQRRIAAATAQASDALVTSLELYVRRLGAAASPEKTSVLPVFSTVGEPANPPPLETRNRQLVLFGGRGARSRAYRELGPVLAAACQALGLDEIVDVGPPLETSPAEVGGIPVRRLGLLTKEEVAALLLGSLAGFVAYPSFFLPKSTIYAAYCAHGVLPVCSWPRPVQDGEVSAGRHYWHPGGGGNPESIAAAARDWYTGHTLARQAEQFRRLLAGTREA
jgi:hypothetical protein